MSKLIFKIEDFSNLIINTDDPFHVTSAQILEAMVKRANEVYREYINASGVKMCGKGECDDGLWDFHNFHDHDGNSYKGILVEIEAIK